MRALGETIMAAQNNSLRPLQALVKAHIKSENITSLLMEPKMSSFFLSTARSRIEKKLERYPLLKLEQLIDWRDISNHLTRTKASKIQAHKATHRYDLLKMFKAVLLGQWHSLSDPELEKCLLIRIDFVLFCGFDDAEIPDETTLCRYRNWLVKSELMPELLNMVNQQLQVHQLQVKQAQTAIVDASIIKTAGAKQPKNPVITEDGEVIDPPKSKDLDARWTKKGPYFYLGYKLNAMTDEEGYFRAGYVSPANEHDSRHIEALVKQSPKNARIQADKGYASRANRAMIHRLGLKDGIMHKAVRGKPLKDSQKQFNRIIKQTRYVVEQSFGTMKRLFRFDQASYFTQERVQAQAILKMLCVNLLKAANKLKTA